MLFEPFVEHVVFGFTECTISRFDVSVNDVPQEFAILLRLDFLR